MSSTAAKVLSVAIGVLALIASGVGSATADPIYSNTDMGFRLQLGGSPLINDSHQVAGNRTVDGEGQGLIWENGVITNLGVLSVGLASPGHTSSGDRIAVLIQRVEVFVVYGHAVEGGNPTFRQRSPIQLSGHEIDRDARGSIDANE